MSAPSRSDADGDLSTRDVAERLGMAVRSVQLMVDRGELRAWKTPGGHRRIAADSVDEWLTRHRARIAAAAPARPARLEEPAAPAYPAPRILLIEDSAHFQNLVALIVRSTLPEADLHIAGDGIAGLGLHGSLQPDLLLVDLLLPGIDGATLITGLRSAPFAKSRVVVVTSLDEAGREPYRMALQKVPVIHKSRLALELPALLHQLAPPRPRRTAR